MTNHYIVSGLASNRFYLLLYNKKNQFMYGIAVFEKNNRVWIADVHISADFSSQVRESFISPLPTTVSVASGLEAGLSNMHQAGSRASYFSQSLTRSLEHDGLDSSAEVDLVAQHAVVGLVEVGLGSLIGRHDASEITREFAGAALATIAIIVQSDEKKADDVLRCLGDIEKCKKSSDDPAVNASMALFGGVLSNDSNQEILNHIVSDSRLRWDGLASGAHRFFDSRIDGRPPYFKPPNE